jgi:hypothetical protein
VISQLAAVGSVDLLPVRGGIAAEWQTKLRHCRDERRRVRNNAKPRTGFAPRRTATTHTEVTFGIGTLEPITVFIIMLTR